ncbi:MAG: DUF1849 family protein [Alphaproteobacteria bacterium]
MSHALFVSMKLKTPFLLLATLIAGTTPAAQAATVVKIVPHRAVYQMSLAQSRQTSQIINAEGKMTYTLGDACDGWTNEQKLEMKYYYAQGQVVASMVSNASWEAKDGSRYSFAARSGSDGQENSAFRGEATRDDVKNGKVTYVVPQGKEGVLQPGTIFPNHHTVQILQAAADAEKMPNKIVFDGSDENGQSEISIFIGKPTPFAKDAFPDVKLHENPLIQGESWPIRMAFYPMKPDGAGMPDYEMTMDMLPNGVARSMLVDYGDFTVRGVLTMIETMPQNGC